MEGRQYEVFSAMCISDEDQPLLDAIADCSGAFTPQQQSQWRNT
jgi:hypothetical protein